MKICFIIPSLAGGGAERVAVTVLSALDGTRHERMLYLFSGADGVYFDRIAPGIRVVIAERRSWAGRLWELASFLRSARPDIVMPFLSYFITAIAVRLAGVPSRVVFNQGTPTTGFLDDPDFAWRQTWRRRVFATLTRLFYARADAVVVTSEGVAEDLVANYQVPRSRIRVLHNPVDLDAIVAAAGKPLEHGDLAEEHPLVAAAGRLAGVKNYPLLLDAIAELSTETPVHAWILGDGVERLALEKHVAERGLGRLVKFLGFQQNPWRFITRADVFVLTSTYEGFGNVLIEAMACGTPVVATRSPGTAEIIEHGANGLLVDHEPRAVAGAIASLIADRPLRDRLVNHARESVRQYALPQVAARYDRLFQELTA
ncbi:MAG: glycosyltransferase [Acidobacteriota bacterium]|nr:glycosyltransferase [Acidobacteriota bacterium]